MSDSFFFDTRIAPSNVSFDNLQETLRVSQEIIENLSPEALIELNGGNEQDLDNLLRNVVSETHACLFGGLETANSSLGKFNNQSLYYLEKLSETVNDVLIQESFIYFLMNIMPDFELNWHHVEWCDALQRYKYLCLIAARDHGKCLSPETPVRMYDGSIKLAKDIVVGDEVMGVDSTPRTVLSTHSGKDQMFKIKQSFGDDYIVNSQHILTLIHKDRRTQKRNVVDISLPELQKFNKNWLHERYKGFKVGVEYKEKELPIEPYFLGIWLGDGNRNNTMITSFDKEPIQYIHEYAKRLGMKVSKTSKHLKGDICRGYKITPFKNSHGGNYLLNKLREYNLLPLEDGDSRKHIPDDYLYNSKKNMLELLAGIMDSDGNKYCGSLHFGNLSELLVYQVNDLACSLGFKTHLFTKFNKKYKKMYYGVSIHGLTHEIPTKIPRKTTYLEYKKNITSHKIPEHTDGLNITMHSHVLVEPVGVGDYNGFTCDGDQRFVLGDGTVTHNSFCMSNAYPAWKLYRYKKNSKRTDLGKLGKEGWLFSFSKTQGSRLLTVLKDTIKDNPILYDRLYPGSDGWAETKIVCKNGAKVIVGSAGESVRGAHPGWIVVDDFLKDNVLYSKEQRDKSNNYFHSVIMNMIQPTGTVTVIGTPFHQNDLYGDLKTKNGWHVREYPSIFPDGRILWQRRYDFATLMEKKITQGSINFSREHLCRPVSNDSSIFPFHILERALLGAQLYTMVQNIESFPLKLDRVGIGVDLAISANVGADYTVFVVGGVDSEENIWILNVVRMHGASYDEQIAKLKSLNFNFRPQIIQIETNGFQAMFGQGATKENMPVSCEATTSKSKNDLKTGLPGLALMFERGKIKIPSADQNSKDIKDLMFSEFSSITWTDKGLQATSGHDDIPMAVHQLVKGLDYRNTGFGFQWM